MPPLPPLPNTVKVQFVWAGPNATKANNFYYALMGTGWTPTPANLLAVAEAAFAAFGSISGGGPINLANAAWSLNDCVVYDNGGTTENQAVFSEPQTGQVTGNCLPPNCAAVCSWTIPAHYRGGHPRTYLPGISESALTSPGYNSLATSFRTNLGNAFKAFANAFNAALIGSITEELGTIAHKRLGVLLDPPVFYPYTAGTIHGRLDSQRRRLGKESLFL